MRLNKYLASCGLSSRRGADELIAAGRVKVNGLTACTGQEVFPESEPGGSDVITVDGKPAAPQKKVMVAVWKPTGVISAAVRQGRTPIITELVDTPERLFPVGRLDKDSEGLLLLTDMGDLSEKIAKAGTRHEKEYEVTVKRKASDGFLNRLAKGVYITLESGGEEYRYLTRTAKVKRITENSFSIILTEGKNRQIRKMCEELGNPVVSLKRIRIMNITLEGLAPGKWRRLSEKEIEELEKQL